MKGYKALDKDMRAVRGNGMQFEIGKVYSVKGEVVPCENGFHFCDKIESLNFYSPIIKSRIFEIEAGGEIIQENDKFTAESICLGRELTGQEISSYFKQNQDAFIESGDWWVREAAADQGYGLERLIYDENWCVKNAVVRQNYRMDILIHDKDWHVRSAVARQGYGLDVLLCDEDYKVRCAVAEQGYGLDGLLRDEDWRVRCAVARQGYGLDVLIQDKELDVMATAGEMMQREGQTIY